MEEILEKLGLTYDELSTVEKETLDTWMDALKRNKITISGIREYIATMRDSVEKELTTTKLSSKQDLFLKARLRNYMLIEAYLSTPEKAKEALDRSLSGIVKKK